MKLFATTAIALAMACFGAAVGYHVVGTIQVGGDGGWDYLTVEPDSRRAFVSHASHVVVLDIDSGKVVGDIQNTEGVHGIALASALNKGFTSNGRENNVTVFDLKSLKPIAKVQTGRNPDSITWDARTNRVFTFNGRSNDSSVIDAVNSRAVATIPLGGKPEFAVNDGHGRIFVNIEDTAEVAAIDVQDLKVSGRYPLTGCKEPTGLALDPAKHRLFSVCANKVMVISDPDHRSVIATVPIGGGSDGAGFDVDRNLAFSSNGDGTLTVVSETGGKYGVLETVPTQRGARTMTIDARTHRVLLPCADFAKMPAGAKTQRPSAAPGTFRVLLVGR